MLAIRHLLPVRQRQLFADVRGAGRIDAGVAAVDRLAGEARVDLVADIPGVVAQHPVVTELATIEFEALEIGGIEGVVGRKTDIVEPGRVFVARYIAILDKFPADGIGA